MNANEMEKRSLPSLGENEKTGNNDREEDHDDMTMECDIDPKYVATNEEQ